MKLSALGFNEIKLGNKKVEIRLFDEKRKKVRIGDSITFSLVEDELQKIVVNVHSLNTYESFAELVHDTPLDWGGSHWKNKNEVIENAVGFYSKEKEEKYGYLRIGIELIDV